MARPALTLTHSRETTLWPKVGRVTASLNLPSVCAHAFKPLETGDSLQWVGVGFHTDAFFAGVETGDHLIRLS